MTPDSYRTFEGAVVGVRPHHIDLTVADRVHRLTATPASTFWRGGEVPIDQVRPGDDLLIKLAPDWTIGRGWANLTRAHGAVSSSSDPHYVIQATDVHEAAPRDVLISLTGATRYGSGEHMQANGLTTRRPSMVPGTHVDVIGLREGQRITAATLLYSDPRLAAVNSTVVSPVADQVSAAGDPTYKGYATWFDCPNGSGRCGTCNSSKNNQAAWPALDANCGGCTGSCCSCSSGCKNQISLSCGSQFQITPCGRSSTTLEISDCGPAQNLGLCGTTCSIPGCSGGTGVVVDLTKPTFTRFYSPELGCFPTTVSA